MAEKHDPPVLDKRKYLKCALLIMFFNAYVPVQNLLRFQNSKLPLAFIVIHIF